MNTKKLFKLISSFFIIVSIISCGKPNQEKSSASGYIDITEVPEVSGPVFLIITRTDDFNLIEKNPAANIVTLIHVDTNGNFNVDFSEFGIFPDDKIFLIGFVDNDYDGNIPMPTFGDYIGFYIDMKTMNTAYKVNPGNNIINMRINRRVYDFESEIRGNLLTDDPGEWKLIAYSGELELSSSSLDIDHIIGFSKLNKTNSPVDYSLRIMPYIKHVPILHVYVLAFLDKNKNGIADSGDIIGYHKDKNNMPEPIKINEGVFKGIDINFYRTINNPSEYNIKVKGNFTPPYGYSSYSAPIFIMIARAEKIEDIMSNPSESIKTFKKITPGETSFDLDLSQTDLKPGDQVIVIGLWDKDYDGSFPDATPGDYIGSYMNTATLDYNITLVEGANMVVPGGDWTFDIDKEISDYKSTVEGIITDDEAGEFIVIAYTGGLNSLTMSDIDPNDIIAYKNFTKAEGHQLYSLDIMPYGKTLPIEDVYIIGLLDRNKNGIPDNGDKLGYHKQTDGMPAKITIYNGTLSGIDIDLVKEITDNEYNINITGSFNRPDEYNSTSPPIFIVVAETNNPQDIINNPTGVIKDYKKVNPGEVDFNIDLSQTDLEPGDEVMIIALWDKDYAGGIPTVTTSDMVGYYVNTSNFDYTINLVDGENVVIPSGDWIFNVDKEIYDFTASVEGTINGTDSGDIVLIAYAGEITSMDFSSIDINDIIGYKKIIKSESPYEYSLPIMPYGRNVPIEDVFIIAFLDLNANGIPDSGDKLGFYKNTADYPKAITIYDEVQTGIDIDFTMTIDDPSENSISISGHFNKPDGYDASSPPIFVLVAVTNNMQDLVDRPLEVIKNYQMVKPGDNTFNIGFSENDLSPGDKVMVIGLWDKDFNSGFPNITVGDEIGFYFNSATFQFSVPVVDGTNIIIPDGDWNFDINKTYHGISASVQGTIKDYQSGDLIIIGLAGDLTTLNMSSININNIVGYQKVSKSSDFYDYKLNIFPFGPNIPIENVQMIAFSDQNNNGKPDDGDRIGFYRSSTDHMPLTITIEEEKDIIGIDIFLTKKIYNFNTSIQYKLNPGNHPVDLEPGDNLLNFIVHTNGVDGTNIDADYILGMKILPYIADPDHIYSYNLFNFIDERLKNLKSLSSLSTYVVTIFDRNGDGKPGPGEDIAVYWDGIIWGNEAKYYPKKYYLKLDRANELLSPDNVGFIGQQL